MPTITVKQVSGLIGLENIAKIWVFPHHLPGWFFKKLSPAYFVALIQCGCTLLVLGYQTETQAQTLRARIAAKSLAPARLHIELEFPGETDVLSFRNSYADVLGLAQRISTPDATSASGEQVRVERAAPGEFRSARRVTKFTYDVDVAPPSRLEDMSHVSWLDGERGLLMPSDLLPRPISGPGNFSEVRISLEVPSGWAISSNIDGKQDFVTSDPDKVVFMIGSSLQEVSSDFGSSRFRLTTSGRWPFSRSEALKTSRKILEEYSRVTGVKLRRDSSLMLLPLPANAEPQRWSAEARGNVVVLLMSSRGHRKPLLTRLGILLSHELFHLWVPNSLSLDGDYDWFFEGFTLYQALLTDMRLGLISFEDYLETIGRVYLSYLANPGADRLSLIEASEQRWTGAPSLVYDKGMLVAVIYDLMLRSRTGCKASISDVYRELFRSPSTGQGNANQIIIRLLSQRAGMETFVREYIEGRGKLDFESQFLRHGLEIRTNDSRPRLRVGTDLNKAARELLRCLGHEGS